MPIKSPAQKRLMEAAAHTKGGYGGVSQSVGKKFLADDEDDIAQDGVHKPCAGMGCDGCGGSGIDSTFKLGAMDELLEALAFEVEAQRGPVLAFDRAPDGLRGTIVVDMAFDRDMRGSNQGHRTDDFERFHAKKVPITKAGVNPYYGREIPQNNELGLDPGKVYRLLRHPDEIRRGAATSHNVPLLANHVPHNADQHDGDNTVGTVGSEAKYEHPYLYNSLAVWSRDGRGLIDSGSQKELSSAYGYDADMTPGTYEGEPYDGVMRNMKWNHVCLVKKGRAGSDVALDEALKPQQETNTMATKLKSMKATVAYGALLGYLKPKLAMDAAMPNIGKALATFEPGKFKAATPSFVKALEKALGKVKLAQDADLAGIVEGVQQLMASVDGDKTVEDEAVVDPESDPNDMMGGEEDDTSMDEGDEGNGMEALAAYLKSKGVPDDVIAGMPGMAKPKVEKPALDKDTVDVETGPDGKEKPKPFTKGAMDAALKLVETNTINRLNGINAAKAHVRPVVGELDMAFDSAEGVYRKAFEMRDQDVTAIKGKGAEVALKAMWDMVPVPGARPVQIAQDSAGSADFNKMFPNMAKVKRA